MATQASHQAAFPLGFCPACLAEVLTHIDIGPADEEIRRCLHCDTIVTGEPRWIGGDELEANGYQVVAAPACGGVCVSAGCALHQR